MFSNAPHAPYDRRRPRVQDTVIGGASWSGSYLAEMEARALKVEAAMLEDVDMEEEEFTARHQEIEAPVQSETDFSVLLAIDTNVLIKHLNTVQRLFDRLSEAQDDACALLIPTVVINELDSLSFRQIGDAHSSASAPDNARRATAWLLSINRHRRETGRGAIRSQRWSERQDSSLRKGDDRVLDCCLYFLDRGAEKVVLWTEDRNLSLLAEANDVPTINPRSPTVDALCDLLRMSRDVKASHLIVSLDEADRMDLDADLLEPAATPTRPATPPNIATSSATHFSPGYSASNRSSPSTSRRPSPPSLPSSASSAYARSSKSNLAPTIPTDITAGIHAIARAIFAHLPEATPPPSVSSGPTVDDTAAVLRALSKALARSESSARSEDDRMHLFRTIGELNTLMSWLERKRDRRRILEVDVARALTALSETVPLLGIPIDVDLCKTLSDRITVL